MAWNVVIAGGGFAGAACARKLEGLLPKQSARLILVNDVNFILYTPFLPEAAAGLLEPRHVVTPLREILKRTYLRLGAVTAHDPAARTVELRMHDGESEEVRYDQLVLSVGSVSRTLPVPGLDQHAIGFKSLADAIWLRNHVVETLELANATEDPARREQLLTYVFVGGGYAGLEALAELQDFAADAMDSYPRARLHGMRWILIEATERVLPEIDLSLAEYALRQLRGRGIEVRLGTTIQAVEVDSTTLSTGESVPTRTVVWTAGVRPHPSLSEPLGASRRARPGQGRRPPPGRGHRPRLGGGRLRRGPRPLRWARPAYCPARHPPGPPGRSQCRRLPRRRAARRYSYSSRTAFVNLGRYKAVGRIGRRTFSGFLAWWMARTYHLSQIPGAFRKLRAVIDWTVSLPFARDLSEVGSIGHPRPLRDEEYELGGSHRPLDAG